MSSAITNSFIDEEQKDFFHLVLLLYELGNSKLRLYFKNKWPTVLSTNGIPSSNWGNQTSDGSTCLQLMKTKKLKPQFPDQENAIKSGDIEQWDATLLTMILKHLPLGFVLKTSKEFGALKDMRETRNKIAHNPNSKLAKANFTKLWQDSCYALEVFGATKDEIADIEKKLENPTEELRNRLQKYLEQEKNLAKILSEFARENDEKLEEIGGVGRRNHEMLEDIKEKLNSFDIDGGIQIKKSCNEMPPKIALLQERLIFYKDDVSPTDVLENLLCLSEENRKDILSCANQIGNTRALEKLVKLLVDKDKGFDQFVVALRKAKLNHVVFLLDPDESVSEEDAYSDDIFDETKTEVIAGTVVDVSIALYIYEELERKIALENKISSKFHCRSSIPTRNLRGEFGKLLPKGVCFVRTKTLRVERQAEDQKRDESEDTGIDDDAMVNDYGHKDYYVFRFVSVTSIDKFWKYHLDKALAENVKSLLIIETSDDPGTNSLRIELDFPEDDYKKAKHRLEEVELNRVDEKCEQQPVMGDKAENEAPFQSDNVQFTSIPPVFLETDPVELREYQKELAKAALDGKNTIICAPTNSGKTFVAMEIAKQHLECFGEKDTATRKVIFIVNTQNLILQQSQRFEDFLSGRYVVNEISGSNSSEIPLDYLLEESDVIVMTAQILVNALEKNSVCLSQISLLIFDECHHTNKEHAYNKIMQRYVRSLKHQPPQEMKLPKIIGLTASLGVGKAKDPKDAEKHILQLCANLDAACISTVDENVDELKEYGISDVPVRNMISVRKSGGNEFEKIISKVMQKIEEDCKKYFPDFTSPPHDRLTQQYRQWSDELEKAAVSKMLRPLISSAEQLKMYYQALVLNDFVQTKDAIESLDKYFEKQGQKKLTKPEVDLQDLFYDAKKRIEEYVEENGQPVNFKLEKLKEILQEGIEKNAKEETEWKGILFSPTRESTYSLKRWITETEELKGILRPDVLIGEGDKKSGMNKSAQDAVIKKFNNGEINILIATTVAEEGLDISTCSSVIRYDMMGNEISSVQARGRVRKKDGQYVYLTGTKSKGIEREKLNDFREMLMVEAVQSVQNIPQEQYNKQVDAIQRENILECSRKEAQASARKMTFVQGDVTFFCRKCATLACQAHHIRRLRDTYHVVIDPSFVERMQIKPRTHPKKVDDIVMADKIHCRKCDQDWGVTVKIDYIKWPCIKTEGFALTFKDNEKRKCYPRWRNLPCDIAEISNEEEEAFQSIEIS